MADQSMLDLRIENTSLRMKLEMAERSLAEMAVKHAEVHKERTHLLTLIEGLRGENEAMRAVVEAVKELREEYQKAGVYNAARYQRHRDEYGKDPDEPYIPDFEVTLAFAEAIAALADLPKGGE